MVQNIAKSKIYETITQRGHKWLNTVQTDDFQQVHVIKL